MGVSGESARQRIRRPESESRHLFGRGSARLRGARPDSSPQPDTVGFGDSDDTHCAADGRGDADRRRDADRRSNANRRRNAHGRRLADSRGISNAIRRAVTNFDPGRRLGRSLHHLQ